MQFSRPEDELLLQCVRTSVDEVRLQQLLQGEIDWAYLLDIALKNKVVMHVAARLQDYLPAELADQVRDYSQFTLQQSLLLNAHLLQILSKFEQHDIKVIPLKGPVLADLVYQMPALREFGDLDILVDEHDLAQAKSLLESLGHVHQIDFDADEEQRYIQREHHYLFQHAANQTVVELHWRLADRWFSRMREQKSFWDDVRFVGFHNTTVRVPSDEDLLIYLCNHGYRHEWERLSWVVDVARLLDYNPKLDWIYIIEQAGDLNSQKKLTIGLMLASELSDIDLPPEILRLASLTPRLETLLQHAWQNIFAIEKTLEMDVSSFMYHFNAMETWGDRLRYYRHYFQYKLAPYGENKKDFNLLTGRGPFYLIARMVHIIRVHGLAVMKTLLYRSIGA